MKLTKDEMSLLLYLETRAVDHAGRIDQVQMNDDDRSILKEWTKSGFVESGRICSKNCNTSFNKQETSWVKLSTKALSQAHRLRKERAERMWKNKSYITTDEKRVSSPNQ